MMRGLVFSFLLLVCSCNAGDILDYNGLESLRNQFNAKIQWSDEKPYDPEIIGGKEAAKGEFPWQVSFQYVKDSVHFCGGSIIDKSWILTAAHCTKDLPGDFVIVAGEHNLTETEDTEQKRIPDGIHRHQDYDKNGNDENDIALIKLDKPLELNDRVAAVHLPTEETKAGSMCTASGWGARSNSIFDPDMPETLHKVDLPTVSDSVCEDACANLRCEIEETMICAGYKEGDKDTCQGDSGGPLVCVDSKGETTQVGIVSVGYGCALEGLYGIYTEVRYYKDWIASVKQNGHPGTPPPFPSASCRTTALSLSVVLFALLKTFLF